MYFTFSMAIFSFKEFILQKLNAKSSIHTVGCGNEISSGWSKYAESVCTPMEAIPYSISIIFIWFERVYQGTSHNVLIRGIGQLPAKTSLLQWNVAMRWTPQAAPWAHGRHSSHGQQQSTSFFLLENRMKRGLCETFQRFLFLLCCWMDTCFYFVLSFWWFHCQFFHSLQNTSNKQLIHSLKWQQYFIYHFIFLFYFICHSLLWKEFEG